MKKISSRATFFYKKGFPVLLYGVWTFIVVSAIQDRVIERDPMFLVVAIVLAVSAFVWMKRFLWDLVDEVYDSGDALLIRNSGEEGTIAIATITNVSVAAPMNPQRVTLRLATPSKFGDEISFLLVGNPVLTPFTKNKVAEDLIDRVDQARARRTV